MQRATLSVEDDLKSPAKSQQARFERVLQEHQRSLARLARSYSVGDAERNDLLQEIALALWRALPGFRGESSERTFVFRVANNVAQTHALRTRRAVTEEETEVPDVRADPEVQASAGERQHRLTAAIQQLPPLQREVLTLALEELSQQEIASILGITANNVAVRLSRAREALRTALGDLK